MFGRPMRILSLLFLVSAAFMAQSASSNAETANDCFSGPMARRITACTALIEEPTTNANDLEEALVMRGHMRARQGVYPDAMSDLNRAIEMNSESAIALNGRAWTNFKWKNSAEGLADVEKSLLLQPGAAPTWDTRAHIRQVLGNFMGAFNDYETAVGLGGPEMVKIYQCGLRKRGLYKGPIDGIYSARARTAMKACSTSPTCDPLPAEETKDECDAVTS
jgi:tetratricopeptide (TPR) repeat protein